MLIYGNGMSSRAYGPYAKTLGNLQKSAARLGSGEKFAMANEGSGELSVAHRMQLNIKGTNALTASMQNGAGLTQTQDTVLSNVSDIVTRMAELAASAVDPTKSSEERTALEQEFRNLSAEIADVANDVKYNGTRAFDTTRTLRIGMETSDIITLSRIRLSLLTATTLSISTVTAASGAIISLRGRAASLAVLRSRVRGHSARIDRTLSYTRDYVTNLSDGVSAIKNIDLALESANFTKQQVSLAAAQSVIVQSNQLAQSAMQFLQ